MLMSVFGNMYKTLEHSKKYFRLKSHFVEPANQFLCLGAIVRIPKPFSLPSTRNFGSIFDKSQYLYLDMLLLIFLFVSICCKDTVIGKTLPSYSGNVITDEVVQ
ncbi:hypothetical protein HA402_015397 [Bradysia odoriphaga]|nr:hypothetical protein HA402_015397 [Bradysia odoriphaga]